MTQPSSPPPNPNQDRHPRRILPTLLKVGAGLGGVALVGGVAVLVWGDNLFNDRLVPWVETALERSLDRPFELGNFERLTWNGVRLGPSRLPPTEAVASGATAEAVNVTFSWPDLLFSRSLRYSLTFIEADIALVQAADGRWVDLTLPDPEEDKTRGPVELELVAVRVEGGRASVFRDLPRNEAVVEAEAILITDLSASAEFLSPAEQDLQEVLFEVSGRIDDGEFAVDGEWLLEEQAYNIALQSTNLPTAGFNLFLPPSLGIVGGTLDSNLVLELRSQTESFLTEARGTARLRNGEVLVAQLPAPITDIDTTLRFRGEQVMVDRAQLQLGGEIPLTAAGTLDLDEGYDLAVEIPAVAIATVTDLLELNLPIAAAGEFGFDGTLTGDIDQPRLAGQLQNQGLVQLDEVTLETLTANFAATSQQVDLQTLRMVPVEGGFITGAGQVDLATGGSPAFALDLQADLPGDALAAKYGLSLPNQAVLGSVLAEGDVQGTVENPLATLQFRLPEATYPGRGELTYQDNTLVVDNARFQVEQGTLDATATAQLDRGTWTAQINTTDLPVNRFTDRVQGLLTADLTAAGSLDNLSLQALQANGTAQITDAQLTVAPGAPSLLEPGDWTTAFRWAGNGIQVERFSAPGVEASGFVAASLGAANPIGPVDLDVQVNRYRLDRLAQLAPANVRDRFAPSGLVSFDGQITGPLRNLRLVGNAQVNDLALDTAAFESQLSGPVNIARAEGGTIALRGRGDRILATLDENLRPSQFDIRLGDTIAVGQVVNQQLTATVQNVPIDAFGVAPVASLGPLGGTLDGTITADLSDLENLSVQGTASILNPTLDTLVAESLEAQFTYADGRLELANAALAFDDSLYQVTGWLDDVGTPTPQYYAQIDIVSGNFQDLLATLNWETFADLGLRREAPTGFGAEVLDLNAAGLPPAPFLEQLEAFALFLARYERQTDDTELALPALADLRGTFSGTVTLQGNGFAADALQAEADIEGQNWTWGNLITCDSATIEPGAVEPSAGVETIAFGEPLNATGPGLGDLCNRFTLAASYDQGSFNVDPLLFEADDTQISFVGDGSPQNLSGQLEMSGVPVELAELFVDIPVEADGDLALVATLDGSLGNPTVVGDLAVVNPSLNEQPLESVAFDFTYADARLRFDGAAVVAAPAEVTLRGDIPYALPFMAVQPDSEQIDVQANLEDEGLELLNLVTDERVGWQGGQGRVSLQIGGTLDNPAVVGQAEFQNGVLVSTALSEPVTDLTGRVRFNREQVLVEQLQANYGGGEIVVAGRLPVGAGTTALAATKQAPAAGLTIALNQVEADYEGFVEAELDGEMLVAGSLLNPIVTGTVQVGDGVLRANDLLGRFETVPAADVEVPEDDAADPLVTEPLPEYVEEYRAEIDGFDLPEVDRASLDGPLSRVRLSGLTLNLSNDLAIVGQPFYYITASGSVEVNGTLTDLRPSGVLTLDRGWINLFSTQFRLVRDAANTATFFPEAGLDPFLDVQMRARVQDADVAQITEVTPFNSAEVTAPSGITTFGEVEFVSIFATAYGYVSDLQDSATPGQAGELLTLTSRPARSQEELLALLGSSVVTNVYSASLTQLTGFVGAGAIASFGDRIADAVGLRSFSIFPTTDTATESTVGIGIGVEAAFDLGEDASIDVLEVLNNSKPPQYGLSYRITDRIRARGTTNFAGDNIFLIEYESRF
ncbi:translocation/assembly module TamB domain-containing protein [Nodosilinea sp. LEGE 06152]|uniref:translocation/assembly module TamB domain-containing protein n=1 Tax=Nodosilinea sp. LEGE 06152 TaxID=2777966 RepID=UPI001882D958|nr:translocation/assembly module TamB domain-containing protein [Nodosilinea sp. LEGE 06152]MBE9157759.1 translocation/assembly module TamB domain-containing protein [Nodosilinea sp. LEGE 06152]